MIILQIDLCQGKKKDVNCSHNYLCSWAELDTRVSVLSKRELDTAKALDSSLLLSSLAEDWIFPDMVPLSDGS